MMLLANSVTMIGAMHRGARRPSKSLAQLERDAALARLGRVRRWVIAGAAALTAGFATLVSAVTPGRSAGAQAQARGLGSSRTPVRRATPARMPPLASASELGLQGPSQAPESSSAPSQSSSASSQSPSASSQSSSAPSQSSSASSQSSSAPSQSSSAPSQAAPAPAQAAPAPAQAAPAPAQAAPAPAVVSGGS
jgi:hypothetical protein